jgi:hypothetical protein
MSHASHADADYSESQQPQQPQPQSLQESTTSEVLSLDDDEKVVIQTIKLVSNDQKEFVLPKKVARISELMRTMIDGGKCLDKHSNSFFLFCFWLIHVGVFDLFISHILLVLLCR